MYLAKYILCAMVFAAALLFALRVRAARSIKSRGGTISRALLSLLMLALVGTIWHYATEDNLTFKWVVDMSRYVPAVLFVVLQFDVWSDTASPEVPATDEATEAAE